MHSGVQLAIDALLRLHASPSMVASRRASGLRASLVHACDTPAMPPQMPVGMRRRARGCLRCPSCAGRPSSSAQPQLQTQRLCCIPSKQRQVFHRALHTWTQSLLSMCNESEHVTFLCRWPAFLRTSCSGRMHRDQPRGASPSPQALASGATLLLLHLLTTGAMLQLQLCVHACSTSYPH